MPINKDMKDFIETFVTVLDIPNHPFFSQLSSGNFTKDQFIQNQIEFSHLVSFFNRPMAQVIANIENSTRRMAIVENLWEEHGQGDPEKVHGKTILTLIDRLGLDSSKITKESLSPNILIFNEALRSAATFNSYHFSTAMFGAIERVFVDVSSLICQAIVDNGWLRLEEITHYCLHKEIDMQHAEDFFMVVNDDWESSEHQATIKEGIYFGANLFLNVYSGFAKR